jgi:hypothetical protein
VFLVEVKDGPVVGFGLPGVGFLPAALVTASEQVAQGMLDRGPVGRGGLATVFLQGVAVVGFGLPGVGFLPAALVTAQEQVAQGMLDRGPIGRGGLATVFLQGVA